MSSKNVSVKSINGNLYVYNWSYIPSHLRKSYDNRFRWKYVGPVNSPKVKEFLDSLTEKEQQEVQSYIQQKMEHLSAIESYKQELLSKEPFRSQQKNLLKINNRYIRIDRLKELDKKLKRIARQKIEH